MIVLEIVGDSNQSTDLFGGVFAFGMQGSLVQIQSSRPFHQIQFHEVLKVNSMVARAVARKVQRLTKRLPFAKRLIARKAFCGAIYNDFRGPAKSYVITLSRRRQGFDSPRNCQLPEPVFLLPSPISPLPLFTSIPILSW